MIKYKDNSIRSPLGAIAGKLLCSHSRMDERRVSASRSPGVRQGCRKIPIRLTFEWFSTFS